MRKLLGHLTFANSTGPMKRTLQCSLLVLTVVLLALPVAASAKNKERVWTFKGKQTDGGDCNANFKVTFDATYRHGTWQHVTGFTIKNYNYPNGTPPVPDGEPVT